MHDEVFMQNLVNVHTHLAKLLLQYQYFDDPLSENVSVFVELSVLLNDCLRDEVRVGSGSVSVS